LMAESSARYDMRKNHDRPEHRLRSRIAACMAIETARRHALEPVRCFLGPGQITYAQLGIRINKASTWLLF